MPIPFASTVHALQTRRGGQWAARLAMGLATVGCLPATVFQTPLGLVAHAQSQTQTTQANTGFKLPDAKQWMAQLTAQAQSPDADADADDGNLVAALKNFAANRIELPPHEAAVQWLDLFEAMVQDGDLHDPDAFAQWQAGLPAPETWPELKTVVENKLSGTDAQVDADNWHLAALAALANELVADKDGFAIWDGKLMAFAKQATNEDLHRHLVQTRLWKDGSDLFPSIWLRENPVEQLLAAMDPSDNPLSDATSFAPQLEVPAFPDGLPEAKKHGFGLQLLQAHATLNTGGNHNTLPCLSQLAAENMDLLAEPQWGLVTGELSPILMQHAVALSLQKLKQPVPDNAGVAFAELLLVDPRLRTVWYVNRLAEDAAEEWMVAHLKKGDTDTVVQFLNHLLSNPKGASILADVYFLKVVSFHDNPTVNQHGFACMLSLLAEHPDWPLWDPAMSFADTEANRRALIDLIDRVLSQANRPQQHKLRDRKLQLLLAIGDLEPAAAMLLEAFDASKSIDLAFQLYHLAKQKKRPEWAQQAYGLIKTRAKQLDDSEALVRAADVANVEGDINQAFAWISQAMQPWVKHHTEHPTRPAVTHLPNDHPLLAMARLYHQQGQHQAVLDLLDQAPWWPITDLADAEEDWYSDFESIQPAPSLFELTAEALLATGKAEQGTNLLRQALVNDLGNDALYRPLVEHLGMDAMPLLKQLQSLDRFEERPLIWQAHLLNQQGEHAQAAALAKQAIAIDPSDGEQGKNDRMRVYAELAAALDGLGQTEDAQLYHEVVAAIRMAEDADDLYELGLTQEAITQYKASLERFAGAYCIQSRLAVYLQESGKLEEAEAHFRKAFELMPDSFGRIESHCFGCEGVFSSGLAQNIAEEVFNKLLAERPDQPQLHYLMGYLKENQDRPAEALQHHLKAVALDPDYFNAWKHVYKLSEHAEGNDRVADQALLNLARLDPSQSRFGVDFRNIPSPQARWRIASALPAKQRRPRKPQTLYRLAAASAAQNQTDDIDWGDAPVYNDDTNPTAAEAVLDLTHGIEWLNMANLLSGNNGNLSHDDGFDFDFYR